MKKSGFTLIELLVVIAIIGILTSIVMTNFASSRSRARDAKRVSDLGQIQLALELYFDRCKQYPPESSLSTLPTAGTTGAGCSTGINLDDYISVIPTDTSNSYVYKVDGTPPNNYVLRATLENNSEVLKDDLDGTQINNTECNDNTSPYYYCIGPK